MQQKLLQRELLSASEGAAFDRIAAEPFYQNNYLNATRSLAVSPTRRYDTLWPSRSMVTRVLERRQVNARAAGTAAADTLDRLRGNRRRTEQLLQDPRIKAADRDTLQRALADERDTLERELLAAIPVLKRRQERDILGPKHLQEALPPGTAFIDIIRYTRFEYERSAEGKTNEKRAPNYVAFLLVRGRAVQGVELGEAAPIDAAVRSWRQAIDGRTPSPEAGRLARQVWEPLAKQLPPGTATVYLAADGDLARVPWAALPVAKNRVLLEDVALATVPHGSFLLEQFKFPRSFAGPESLLTLGGVDYGPGIWPALPGTATEVAALSPLAPTPPTTLTKTAATAKRLTELLPTMRYAHLATHGELKAAERRREIDARTTWREGTGLESRRVATKNPLGFTGLVLANGEILTGLSLVDLPLENLKLVTLSACETGLGLHTDGEGVFGLVRAFHLAGCPNVVASLWRVSDAATAALMAKFYHELWVTRSRPSRR